MCSSDLSVYQWLARSVADRDVLDLFCGAGDGAVALLAAGARQVTTVAATAAFRRFVERVHVRPGLRLVDDGSDDDEARYDLVIAVADTAVPAATETDGGEELRPVSARDLSRLLRRGGRLVIAAGGYAGSLRTDSAAAEARFAELEETFLRLQRYAHLPPDGYQVRFSRREPARARAQEYRFVEIGPESTLPRGAIGEVWVGSTPRALLPSGPLRLHVGSGMEHLDGWLNVDLLPLPGVDLVLDGTRDLRFDGVEAIYAEHFLEHLPVMAAVDFLVQAHRALAPSGRLRLSTPNLDWVWQTHYRRGGTAAEQVGAALSINRAFYGWSHRVLWNRELLELVLGACGFRDLEWPDYGESRFPILRGLERHERYPDADHLSHVLIVEAARGDPVPERLAGLRKRLERELVVPIEGWGGIDLGAAMRTPRADDP